jgi:hypothetical protein
MYGIPVSIISGPALLAPASVLILADVADECKLHIELCICRKILDKKMNLALYVCN